MAWAQALTAISTTLIAVLLVGLIVAAIAFFRETTRAIRRLEEMLSVLSAQAAPTLQTARDLLQDTRGVVDRMRREADDVVDASRSIRRRVMAAADRIEDRLVDLDSLVEVAQTEIEDTVLDVTAALRTSRKGVGLLRGLRKAMKRR